MAFYLIYLSIAVCDQGTELILVYFLFLKLMTVTLVQVKLNLSIKH